VSKALLLELDFPALLGERARCTAARESEVGSLIASEGVARASQPTTTHADETTAAEAVRHAVDNGVVADDTLHRVLADGAIFERLVPGTVATVRNTGQEPRDDTGQGVCETIKWSVGPVTLAVDDRQIVRVTVSTSLHGLRGAGLLVISHL